MLNIPTWKKILILLVCALGFIYSAPNLIHGEKRAWMQENLPGLIPHKTVNLGLDLRGGAHLLYEVDVNVVEKERADQLLSDLRTGVGALHRAVR